MAFYRSFKCFSNSFLFSSSCDWFLRTHRGSRYARVGPSRSAQPKLVPMTCCIRYSRRRVYPFLFPFPPCLCYFAIKFAILCSLLFTVIHLFSIFFSFVSSTYWFSISLFRFPLPRLAFGFGFGFGLLCWLLPLLFAIFLRISHCKLTYLICHRCPRVCARMWMCVCGEWITWAKVLYS